MFFTDETFRAVIVATIQAHGTAGIDGAVSALIAADRKLSAYESEPLSTTPEDR